MTYVRSAGGPRRTRAEWYAIIKPLRDSGLSGLAIARRTGLASSFVYELLNDPDGTKAKLRKDRNRKPCVECGKPTVCDTLATGLCIDCYRAFIRVPHGTRSRYASGCSCDECRRAIREYHRQLTQRGVAPNHGTNSGYSNYGCRCEACTRAHRDYEFLTLNNRFGRKKTTT